MEISLDFVTIMLASLAFIAVVTSYLEMRMSKRNSIYKMDFPKTKTMITNTELGTKYPVYVYNVTKVKKEAFEEITESDKEYVDTVIPIHLGARIVNPLKAMCKSLINIPKSKMPMNKLYLGLSKSDEIINNVNPLAPIEDTEYHVMIHIMDVNKIEVFMDDKIYFIR